MNHLRCKCHSIPTLQGYTQQNRTLRGDVKCRAQNASHRPNPQPEHFPVASRKKPERNDMR